MIISKDKYILKNCVAHIVGCSVMGCGKIENQDSIEIRQTNDSLIVVVADGLGSAAYSKEGSEKAVKITADILTQKCYENLSEKILSLWKENLQGNLNQYDTTIKFIQITNEKIIVGGVGDGWIALKNNNDIKSFVVENPFSNQTDSILSIGLDKKFWTEEFDSKEYDTMIIATDGFSEDINKEDAFEFLKQAENEIKEDIGIFATDLEETLSNWPVQTNRDDKTVVFVVLTKED